MPEVGRSDGHNVGSGRRVVAGRRAELRLVLYRPDQRASGRSDLRRGRMPAAGVGGRKKTVVPSRSALRREQRAIVVVSRDAVGRRPQHVDHDHESARNVMLTRARTHHGPK